MKKTYSKPETECLDIQIDAIMLNASESPAKSSNAVLSKERAIFEDDEEDFED